MWWIFTILLGLSVSRVVISMATITRLRLQGQLSKVYPPVILWEVFLLIFVIEVWFSAAEYKKDSGVLTVPILAAFAIIPVGTFVLVEFLTYDERFKITDSEGVSMTVPQREQFDKVRKAFFIVLAVIPMFTIAVNFIMTAQLQNFDLILPALVTLGALIGLALPDQRAQTVLASIMIATVVVFIVLEYELIGQLPILNA